MALDAPRRGPGKQSPFGWGELSAAVELAAFSGSTDSPRLTSVTDSYDPVVWLNGQELGL